jgi:hypothetical protein
MNHHWVQGALGITIINHALPKKKGKQKQTNKQKKKPPETQTPN